MTAHMDGGPSGAMFGTFIVYIYIYILLYAYRYYHVCDNTYHIICQESQVQDPWWFVGLEYDCRYYNIL